MIAGRFFFLLADTEAPTCLSYTVVLMGLPLPFPAPLSLLLLLIIGRAAGQTCSESDGSCAAEAVARLPELPDDGAWVADPDRLLQPETVKLLNGNLSLVNATSGTRCYMVLLSSMPEGTKLRDLGRGVAKKWWPQVSVEKGSPGSREAEAANRRNRRLVDNTAVLVVAVSAAKADLWTGSRVSRRIGRSQARHSLLAGGGRGA